MATDKTKNLRKYFAAPVNSVTRERIFFNRLSFDLKLAAAKMDYHLHLYEPNVDRNGFDIVAEDDDNEVGWFQTKAVLASAKTATWKIGIDFLRPAPIACEAYGWDLPEAGRGGGVILIEIRDEDVSGSVTYRNTDFDILATLAEGLLRQRPQKGRGKRAKSAQLKAAEIIAALKTSSRDKVIVLPANVFVTVQSPDDLLGLMKMRSELCYSPFAVRNAYRSIDLDTAGTLIPSEHSIQLAASARYHLELLCKVQPDATPSKYFLFDTFRWRALPGAGTSPEIP